MKKVFELRELDCANCAAKMERKIKMLPGVTDCSISFMSGRMTLEAEDGAFDGAVAEAAKLIKKIEPDCTLVV